VVLDNPEIGRAFLRDVGEERANRSAVSPERIKARLIEEFPEKLHFLFEPHPYKIAWGGRYGIKSWSFSAAILTLGLERPLRVVCLRETMKSLADSVHALLSDQINRLRIQSHYRVLQNEIRGANGTEIFYAGLRGAVADSIKSMEGCDIFWVEEGQTVSKQSWLTLDPTIRKPGAELWVSMNPRFAKDDSYERWILTPPPGAVVEKTNYRDNKFLTPGMLEKIEFLRATDPDMYEHVYEGATLSTVQDAVYKAEIKNAEKEGRFRRVPYDARKPVEVAFDLGWGDLVAMWFYQAFPFETRFIDYYENTHQTMDHYLQVMQSKGYTYGELIFPWDGGVASLTSGKSSLDIARNKGFRVRLLRQGLVHDRIEMVRTLFPLFYFDGQKCERGLEHLRSYQWGPPSSTGVLKREPLHDIASHAGDALGYAALALKTPAAGKASASAEPPRRSSGGSLAGFR
jgi:phage terminase large subunit